MVHFVPPVILQTRPPHLTNLTGHFTGTSETAWIMSTHLQLKGKKGTQTSKPETNSSKILGLMFTITIAIRFPCHSPSKGCMHKNRQRDVTLHFVHVYILSFVVGQSVHCFVSWLNGRLASWQPHCFSIHLKMEAAHSSDMLEYLVTPQCSNPKDGHHLINSQSNFKRIFNP